MSELLYRVVRKTTGSVQPGGDTYWNREVLYCGYDRDEARRVYHESEPSDVWQGYGNRAVETVGHVIRDAETEDFADDELEEATL